VIGKPNIVFRDMTRRLCLTGSLDDSVELQLHDKPSTPTFRSSSHTNNETVDSPLPIVIISSSGQLNQH
jgi:hypothetical protein